MKLERIWSVLTQGERLILVASAVLLTAALIGGGLVLATTPFQSAQEEAGGGNVVDSDGDGLSDDNEILLFGTNPDVNDTDGDGMPDGWEALHARVQPDTGLLSPDPLRNDSRDDPDEDGLTNLEEFRAGTDPQNPDSDGDGLLDGWEVDSGHDPLDPATTGLDEDGDGLTAAEEHELGTLDNELDTDRDGLTDLEETRGSATIGDRTFQFTPTDPALTSTGGSGLADGFAVAYGLDPHAPNVGRQDPDGDGLSTAQEARISLDRFPDTRTALVEGLDPQQRDTDRDGLPDGWEVANGLDPLDPTDGDGDTDGDGLTNGEEFFWNTDPLEEDTDGDGLLDGEEVTGFELDLNGRTIQASSNPLLLDSDGDGLTDLEEQEGSATIEGQEVTFPPTHPLLPDSDGDGIRDAEELALVFRGERLDPTLVDTDTDGIDDGDELTYWQDRQEQATAQFPAALTEPESGECSSEAAAAIRAQDPSVLGPAGDPDGDCIPNILDPDSDRGEDAQLPPGTNPLPDGLEIDPPLVEGRQRPASDPAVVDTDDDGLPDEWEADQARFSTDVNGVPAWLFDPSNPDSFGDGIPDGEDDFEGKVPGTATCWDNVYADGGVDEDTTGDSVPWLAASYTNRDEMLRGSDPFSCDTDEDRLNDGWEVAFQSTGIDPLTPTTNWWAQAEIATICYPDTGALRSINNLNLPRLGGFATAPAPGPVTSAPAEDLRPGTTPQDRLAWSLTDPGCAWTGTGAERGTQCPTCSIVGIVATLELQQWYKVDPTTQDTDGDGGPDAWEILWNNLASPDQSSLVRPDVADGDSDGDGAEMAEEHLEGASPLLPDTDGDGENDGPDQDPLSEDADRITITDADSDHLLDGCQGTQTEEDPDRQQALRDLQIVEVEPEVFLCEPGSDPDGLAPDADGDGIPDAWEMLYTYRETGSANTVTLRAGSGNSDGDQLRDTAEYKLGRPATWATGQVWWFGSNPFQSNGYDADGDGIAEALFIDPDPFENLPSAPTEENAWTLACDAGIVCPGDSFSWVSSGASTELEVTLQTVGEERGPNREVSKDGEDLPLKVRVNRSGSPAADAAVAILALDANEAVQLQDGDLSMLAQPDRVLCIVTTGTDGVAESPSCTVESTPTTGDLTGTSRTWLGSTSPSWDRDLSVLDPTESKEVEDVTENQPRIVAWAMGSGTDPGATDQQPVVPSTKVNVTAVDLPERVASGSTLDITARILDGAGDPLQDGQATLVIGNDPVTQTVEGEPTVTFRDVQLPSTQEATLQNLDLRYEFNPADYVEPATHDAQIRLLPVPEVQLKTAGEVTAGGTLQATVEVESPTGDPVLGPVQLAMGTRTVNGTTGSNGTTELSLEVPPDQQPGLVDLTATFLGTDAFGASPPTEQQVKVFQQLTAEVQPRSALLGQEVQFAATIVDLAGRAPNAPVNVSLEMAGTVSRTQATAGEDLVTLPLTVDGPIGEATARLTAIAESNYRTLREDVTLEVRSEALVSIQPRNVPRGENVTLRMNVTDALDRAVPAGQVTASWRSGTANATIEDGVALLPFHTEPDAPAEPITVSYSISGPGLIPSSRTEELGIRIGTNLTGDVQLDALSGITTVNLRLVDDRGNPVPAAPIQVAWPLGDSVEATTDAEGRAQATLVIPETAQPGDVPVQLLYEGDGTLQGQEVFLTAPVRSPTRLDVQESVVWAETKDLVISGRVVAAGSGQGISLPVQVLQGTETVARTSGGVPFSISIPPEDVESFAGGANRFTLAVVTPGDDTHAPAETTIVVNRLTPVDISTSVERLGDRVVLRVTASTPQGPLQDATINVGREDGAPVTITTDADGQASVTLQGATGTLVARYPGDGNTAPSEARVDLATQAAATSGANLAAFAIGTFILLLLVVDGVILFRVYRLMDLGRQVEELLEDLEKGLVAGDEIRAVIYQGYLRLRAIGEVMGEPEAEWETAREFGNKLSDRLEIPGPPVVGLVGAFEEARYAESVDPGLRMRVLDSLRTIREDMRERGLIR